MTVQHARDPRPVLVREGTMADLDMITHLWVQGARTHLGLAGYARDLPEDRLHREASLWARDYLGNRYGAIFLAFPRDEGPRARPVGIVSAMISNRSILHADDRMVTAGDAFVTPAWRRQGVLRALVSELESWAAARAVTGAVAEFAADNPGARDAWHALGYTDEAVRVRKDLDTRRR